MNGLKAILEKLPGVVRYLLVLGVVVFISFLFPNNLKFLYNFEKGRSWQYEDLMAPFDFAILKSEDEINIELQRIESELAPYYEWNDQLVNQKKASFQKSFSAHLDEIAGDNQFPDVKRNRQVYINYGETFLDNIYKQGIIALAPEHTGKDKNFVINILNGSYTHPQTLETLLTVENAVSKLGDELPYSKLREPEFLLPILEQLIQPNLTYDSLLTKRFENDKLQNISKTRDKVKQGEVIIRNNELINDEAYQKLISLKGQYEKQLMDSNPRLYVFIGYFLLTSLIIGVFMVYLRINANEIYSSTTNMVFIFLWVALYGYMVYFVESTSFLVAYIIPFCIVPIVIKTFFNARVALFTHIIVVLIASFLSSLDYEFTFLQLLAGIVVLLSNVNTHDWTRFFYSMVFIFFTYAIAFMGLSLIAVGDILSINWRVFSWIFLNVFLTLLAYPLIPLLERLFGFTSSISLIELSDMNRPLLKTLVNKAPGTLQHSLQVANLSEAAAREIGADHLLVKVGALYHDIGKTKDPLFYIENQSGNSPHDELNDLESAKMIIAHVTEGVKMAKKARLPKVLIDFIKTHHGTTRVEYFYRNFQNEHPDMEIDEADFRYPGPKPRSKEETILMLADSIEAACKSLKNPTKDDIDNLIDKIIDGKMKQGQFADSDLSVKELNQCRAVFQSMIKSIHHVRIEYPDDKKTESEEVK
ncbi:MAG: HDIG domain-containing metalloprotein [Bacteroidota bacterium]